VLVAGGDGEVAAFSMTDGEQLWTRPVSGAAKGLAVVDGALLVSTDTGHVHCFREGSDMQ
jgi:outer membrane protein assembly factor BamB